MVYKAADSKLGHLRTKEKGSTGGVFGFIRSVEAMVEHIGCEPAHVYVAFERGGAATRAKLMPEYKSDRERGEPFWKQGHREAIASWCSHKGFVHITMPGGEADDAIAAMHKRLVLAGVELIVIMSKDHDFRKLLGVAYPTVTTLLWMKKDEQAYSFEDFYEEFGFSPDLYLEYCALAGDASDNVNGVVSARLAKELVCNSRWGWNAMLAKLTVAAQAQAARNYATINFMEAPIDILPGKQSDVGLVDIYHEWGFNSLLKKMGAMT